MKKALLTIIESNDGDFADLARDFGPAGKHCQRC